MEIETREQVLQAVEERWLVRLETTEGLTGLGWLINDERRTEIFWVSYDKTDIRGCYPRGGGDWVSFWAVAHVGTEFRIFSDTRSLTKMAGKKFQFV